MSQKTAKFLSPQLSQFFYKRILEGIGFLFIFFSLFLLLSLWSYCPSDESFFTFSTMTTQNWWGSKGAFCADVLLQYFGVISYSFSLILLIWGILFLFHEVRKPYFSRLLIAPVYAILLATTLATLQLWDIHINVGHLGEVLSKVLLQSTWIFPYKPHIIIITTLIASLILFSFSSNIYNYEWRIFFNFCFSTVKKILYILYFVCKKIITFLLKTKQKKDSSHSKQKIKKEKEVIPVGIKSDFQLPPINFLQKQKISNLYQEDPKLLKERGEQLKLVLSDFSIKGEIINIHPGPIVTLYELEPAAGVKSSRIISLADDIARSMSALSARVAVVPGKNVIGIELPNRKRQTVLFRTLLEKQNSLTDIKLKIHLGLDISGSPICVDLAKMPHLLVAGTTGSGKSVFINTVILSLLYQYSPKECRLMMIDPKMLELSVYNDIPHLIAPVVTNPKKAIRALLWVVKEMENRYRMMSEFAVRNIDSFNQKISKEKSSGKILTRRVQTGFDPESGNPIYETQTLNFDALPYIVVIVDEMADLMLVAGKEVESSIQRLAQMARAAGIHLIMATQRPSVDVITGTIKANFPSRISFHVSSKIDSRTILGEAGAEQLLGHGDMLYMSGGGQIKRIHGSFVQDQEIEHVVRFLKEQQGPQYLENINNTLNKEENDDTNSEEEDSLYNEALQIVQKYKKGSTSFIQRQLKIGYNRAANIIEQMERKGVLSAPDHIGRRKLIDVE